MHMSLHEKIMQGISLRKAPDRVYAYMLMVRLQYRTHATVIVGDESEVDAGWAYSNITCRKMER